MANEAYINPGPLNSSLLHLQDKHVSNHVWNEEPNRILNVRKPAVNRHDIPDLIVGRLQSVGLYEVARVRHEPLDKELISALVERWRPETHTFHMPFGEVTITLQDVAVLLGLKVDGLPVSGNTWLNWTLLVENMLGEAPPPDAIKGGVIKLSWLRQLMTNMVLDPNDDDVLDRYTRAFILVLLGDFMFIDHTGARIAMRYLALLDDFDQAGLYSWGSALLSHLYHELCAATDHRKSEIAGCTYLIQLWAWTRIPGIGPQMSGLDAIVGHPLATRWNDVLASYKRLSIDEYRTIMDTLHINEFRWMPYGDDVLAALPNEVQASSSLWRAVVPMIIYWRVEWHQPDRVMQQFGMQQPIPQQPLQSEELHDTSLKGKEKEDWVQKMKYFINIWNHRHEYVFTRPMTQNFVGPNDQYTLWYAQHSRRWVTRKAAATGQVAERLYQIWYAYSPTSEVQWTNDRLCMEVERCLALVHEVDRIRRPSTTAPPRPMEVPIPTQEAIPIVGRTEGKGLGRRRTPHVAQRVPLGGAENPRPGV